MIQASLHRSPPCSVVSFLERSVCDMSEFRLRHDKCRWAEARRDDQQARIHRGRTPGNCVSQEHGASTARKLCEGARSPRAVEQRARRTACWAEVAEGGPRTGLDEIVAGTWSAVGWTRRAMRRVPSDSALPSGRQLEGRLVAQGVAWRLAHRWQPTAQPIEPRTRWLGKRRWEAPAQRRRKRASDARNLGSFWPRAWLVGQSPVAGFIHMVPCRREPVAELRHGRWRMLLN